jgi:sterol desaturase/sphingolipid hydroxylase (fatty acid hydroxylase superfamily)
VACRAARVPRTHHEQSIRNTNSNYGIKLSLWDTLFRTANARRRTAEWHMGLDYSRDRRFVTLAALPFRDRRRWAAARTDLD